MTTDQGGHEHGLRANAIGLGGDVIVAVANVAPSSAVAFTLALLLTLTGLASPLVVLIVGALMLCVTLGYAAMNRWRPSAGAPYVWVGEATSPVAGIGTGLLSRARRHALQHREHHPGGRVSAVRRIPELDLPEGGHLAHRGRHHGSAALALDPRPASIGVGADGADHYRVRVGHLVRDPGPHPRG